MTYVIIVENPPKRPDHQSLLMSSVAQLALDSQDRARLVHAVLSRLCKLILTHFRRR